MNISLLLDASLQDSLHLVRGPRFRVLRTDAIRVGDERLLTKVLRAELRQYRVYFRVLAQQITLRFWFWLRDVQRMSCQGDCRKVFNSGTQPDGSPFPITFWVSKKGPEFLKKEDRFKGLFRYKVKLPPSSPDLRPRFKQITG